LRSYSCGSGAAVQVTGKVANGQLQLGSALALVSKWFFWSLYSVAKKESFWLKIVTPTNAAML
jgi:hypothetical protein